MMSTTIERPDTLPPELISELEVIEERAMNPEQRVVVLSPPSSYRQTTLVYGWRGELLAIGDRVLCPPTPWLSGPYQTTVVSIVGEDHPYKGPVKYIIKRLG